MRTLIIALTLAGFVLPVGSAVVAYRQALASFRTFGDRYPPTFDSFDVLFTEILPSILREQVEHLRWPAFVVAVGLACSTVAGILGALAVPA